MRHYEIRQKGQNRGAPRVWLEGMIAAKGGFMPGVRYNAKADAERSILLLEVVEDGVRVVSKKQRGEKDIPIIDINSNELLSIFDGIDTLRVVVKAGRIFILPVASELRAKERLAKLKEKLVKNEPLSTGSVSSGIGILDAAAHEGLAQAGLSSELLFANEIREDCMTHAGERNALYTDKTITLTAPMQELVFDQWAMSQIPEVSILVGGIPCSGASVAGRAKRKLEHPEDHPDVGHLVVAFLAIIAKVNPACVVLENVPQYQNSASMSIIRNQLRDLGYVLHELDLDASDWNMLEHRKRFSMVAVTKGIEFSPSDIKRPEKQERSFGEVMDTVDPEHSTWGNIDYLWSKQERDQAAGKGFAPTVVDEHSTKVPTLNKTLHKRQSTGTFIRHPEKDNLYRIPTVAEHARCKGVDPELVQGTTQTFGHEALGQAISVPPFVAVFEALGNALTRFGMAANADHCAFASVKAAA